MISSKLKLFTLIAVMYAVTTAAMGQVCLDDFCFLTTKYSENISEDLTQGYRAFIVQSPVEDSDLAIISNFLEANPEERVSFILDNSLSTFYEQLSSSRLINHIYPSNVADVKYGVAVNSAFRFHVFSNEDERFLSVDENISKYSTLQNSERTTPTGKAPNNHLTHFYFSDSMSYDQERIRIKNLMHNLGRLPNFLETTKATEFKIYLDSLNSVRKFKAIVLNDDGYLEQVSWNELPTLESTGKVHITENIISPIKKGYRFSPDVSTFTPVNEDVIKIFYAYHQDIETGLIMHLDFDNSILNRVKPEEKHLYEFIKYEEDNVRGMYSRFDGSSNYIDFGIPSDIDFKQITISAWIKPDTLAGNLSIVGIGKVFSAKVFDGTLTFTTPAIQDHSTDSVIIRKNEWQHVAIVYQANKEVGFYHNGINIENQPASDITISSNSLLVGNNLWSEYFNGGIDDLYIWDRVLSSQEITKVYEKDLHKETSQLTIKQYLIIAMMFLGFVVGFFALRKKGNAISNSVSAPSHASAVTSGDKDSPGIYLFGGFRLINKEGENLSSQFSPKRQELFILVLLFTFFKKGINSKRMSEMLWEGHSFESAKNNRSTQVKDIREILSQNTGVSIDYDNKNWNIKIDEGIRWDFSDYAYYRDSLSDISDPKSLQSNINGLLHVIDQGVLLPNMQYEWLDPIKGQLSEEIINTLTQLIEHKTQQLDSHTSLKICNSIFSLDPINERALKIKIKLLVADGKHTLAKNAFDHFCHSYSQFYNEEYSGSFSALL